MFGWLIYQKAQRVLQGQPAKGRVIMSNTEIKKRQGRAADKLNYRDGWVILMLCGMVSEPLVLAQLWTVFGAIGGSGPKSPRGCFSGPLRAFAFCFFFSWRRATFIQSRYSRQLSLSTLSLVISLGLRGQFCPRNRSWQCYGLDAWSSISLKHVVGQNMVNLDLAMTAVILGKLQFWP